MLIHYTQKERERKREKRERTAVHLDRVMVHFKMCIVYDLVVIKTMEPTILQPPSPPSAATNTACRAATNEGESEKRTDICT